MGDPCFQVTMDKSVKIHSEQFTVLWPPFLQNRPLFSFVAKKLWAQLNNTDKEWNTVPMTVCSLSQGLFILSFQPRLVMFERPPGGATMRCPVRRGLLSSTCAPEMQVIWCKDFQKCINKPKRKAGTWLNSLILLYLEFYTFRHLKKHLKKNKTVYSNQLQPHLHSCVTY